MGRFAREGIFKKVKEAVMDRIIANLGERYRWKGAPPRKDEDSFGEKT